MIGMIMVFIGFLLNSKKENNNYFVNTKKQIRYSYLSPFVFQGDQNKDSPDLCLIQDSTLIAATPPISVTSQVLASLIKRSSDITSNITNNRKDIIKYTVLKGDTISNIANKFNISINTILWANNISSNSILRPGQKLTILPVSGLVYIVKKGDTLQNIARIYGGNIKKIIDFNGLNSANEIFENQALIIPDGKMPHRSRYRNSYNGLISTNDFYGLSHHYPYGQCTYWVAQKRAIPSWGNARDWLNNAIKDGYSVCKGSSCLPQAGAVISMKGSKLGHVAYVERVVGNKVIFSEMNWYALGKVDYRSLRVGDPRIYGYIYKR